MYSVEDPGFDFLECSSGYTFYKGEGYFRRFKINIKSQYQLIYVISIKN